MIIFYLYLKGNGFPFPTVNLSLLPVLIINVCVLIIFSVFLNVFNDQFGLSKGHREMDESAAVISARNHVL